MVGLLIITHDQIGDSLLETATAMLGICPMALVSLSIPPICDPEAVLVDAKAAVEHLDRGAGVLVLTDMYGSTPSNIANRLYTPGRVMVVAGLNLPMLIRALNYPDLELMELMLKAVTGGRDGVFGCE